MTPMWRFGPFTTLLLALSLGACSSSGDPVVSKAFSALDAAYASDVKPRDASFTKCIAGALKFRHVALCGISYGADELAQVGAWEIVQADGKFAVYAMNGKALQALDKMTKQGSLTATAYPGVFYSGSSRPPLDIAEVKAQLMTR